MLELFRLARIPSDFITNVLQSACHSFARRIDSDGWCSWFYFLFKNISIRREPGRPPEIDNRVASAGFAKSKLPQADYSWLKASFFLRQYPDGSILLVCFGAPPQVCCRIEQCVEGGRLNSARAPAYGLFDIVLDGLFHEVDDMVWNMAAVSGPLEHSILELAHTKEYARLESQVSFAALHNCAKHIIYLTEGLAACLMVVNSVLESGAEEASNNDDGPAQQQLLRNSLRHRRSLFRSTQLRLSSLQTRIDKTITLAFHVVTQKDSMVQACDSSVMKLIVAITVLFLLTTGVATVAGSQLLTASWHDDLRTWTVAATPLFWLLWWIAIPLTISLVALALLWQWWVFAAKPTPAGLERALLPRPSQRDA